MLDVLQERTANSSMGNRMVGNSDLTTPMCCRLGGE
jgi:hypothetical protein